MPEKVRNTNTTYIIGSAVELYVILELFQLQMIISFPFLRAKDLRTSLLITRTRIFLLSCMKRVHTQD